MLSAERTLSRLELNRALLARQGLLERAPRPLPRVLERSGGLQAQYAPSMYIGLWSRVEGFERDELTRALERRSVVQATLMRATIHLVSAKDYWPFTHATSAARREHWLRAEPNAPDAREVAKAAERLERRLANGPLRRSEIEELIGKPLFRGVGLWLPLVRVPPSGTWERRRADLFDTAERWLGPPEVSQEDALDLLVRRYLGGFGPASRKDVAGFSGLPLRALAPVLERLRLRRFRSEEGEELLDLPRAPIPDPGTPAPVRYLPTWDATLLAHARRTGILPEQYRGLIFNTKIPQSKPTFLVDGKVAGAWKHHGGRIEREPFGHIGRAASRELEAEAGRLLALFG